MAGDLTLQKGVSEVTSTVEYPNWFKITGEVRFQRHLLPLAGQPGLRFLQVGVFTGDASMWLLDNVLTGEGSWLFDVDTWEGSAELAHEAFDWTDVERVYQDRTEAKRAASHVVSWRMRSDSFFRGWAGSSFDFIYIDGAHDTDSALADAEHAFAALKVGGLLAFDDYNWGTVACAVNDFAETHRDQLEPIEMTAQAWFRRTA